MIAGISLASDGLQPARAVHVCWRRNLVAFLRVYRVSQGHERRGVRLLKVFRSGLSKDGRRERPENLAVLDAAVENVLHFRAARIGDDAAIAQSPGAPLRAALKPAEYFSIGDDRGAATRQFFLGKFGDAIAILREAARINRTPDLFARISGSPVSVIHHKRARLSKFLMPHVEGRTDSQSCVTSGGLHV